MGKTASSRNGLAVSFYGDTKVSDEVMGTPDQEAYANPATETETEASQEDAILDELETEANPDKDETPKDEPDQPRKLKVKIDGQELEVDEDEAARGYQRQQDYSRHMQRLQAEIQQAQQERARYQQQLNQFIPESVARINALQQAAEQARQEGNVEQMAIYNHDLNNEILRYQQANSENQRMQEEQAAQSYQQREQAKAWAMKAMLDDIPEWKNDAVRQSEVGEVAKVLSDFVSKHYGEQAAQIMSDINDGMYGSMPIVLARKAMQYDKLMAKVAQRKAGKSEHTEAPEPTKKVRSSGGSSKDPDQMTTEEWMKWRNSNIKKNRS